jgi:hypothetical protein
MIPRILLFQIVTSIRALIRIFETVLKMIRKVLVITESTLTIMGFNFTDPNP